MENTTFVYFSKMRSLNTYRLESIAKNFKESNEAMKTLATESATVLTRYSF